MIHGTNDNVSVREALRVLMYAGEPGDTALIREGLDRAGYVTAAERVDDLAGLRAALARQAWELVTCGCQPGGGGDLGALEMIRRHDPHVAIVVIADDIDVELAGACLRAGADDVVRRDDLLRFPGAVDHALCDAVRRRRRTDTPAQAPCPGVQGPGYADLLEATSDLVFTTASDGRLLHASRAWREALGFRDVTGRAAAERRAREERQLLESVLEVLPVGVWLIDPAARIAHANAAAQRIWGGDRSVGFERYSQYKGWFVADGAPIEPHEWAASRAIEKGETTVDEEIEIECQDGTRKTLLSSATPLRDGSGSVAGAVVVDRDITGSRRAQALLRHSEERFRALVEHAGDIIFVHDMMGIITDVNPAACHALGYGRDELVGRPLTDIDPQLNPDRSRDESRQIWSGVPMVRETVLRRRDGSVFPVEVRAVRFTWNGAPHVLGTARDITQRKHDEDALRAANAQLELTVEHAGVGFWDWDLRTNESAYSGAWRRQFGYDESELRGSAGGWWAILHPDDRAAVATAIRRVLEGAAAYKAELRLRHGNGTYRDVLSRAAVVRDESGRPIRLLGAHIDITEQKRIERGLHDAQAALRLAAESAKVAVWQADLAALTIRFSAGWKDVLGQDAGEIALAALWDLVHPDDRAAVTAAMQDGLQSDRGVYETEQRMRYADGSYRWVITRAAVASDAGGRRRLVHGVDIDITERKALEETLRQSRTQLELATESGRVALWDCDLRALSIRFLSGWQRLLGREEAEVPLVVLWDLVHPDDRARTAAAMQEHIQGRASAYETEQRVRHADGSYRWVLSRGIIARDAAGLPTRFFGADVDITERKALEAALQASEERYRHLVEDITEVIYAADGDGRVTYMSPIAEHLFGYAPAEILGQHFSRFIVPDDLAEVAQGFREAMSGRPQPHDHRILTKSGDVRWVRNHCRPIVEQGHIVGLRGVISDVTERRQAEDALRVLSASLEQQVSERTGQLTAAHERLRLITDNMSDMVSLVDMTGVHQYVSPAHERVLGHAPEQMLGRSIFHFLHPDDRAQVAAAIDRAVRTASAGHAECRYRHADGHYVWLETDGRLFCDDRGVAVGAVLSGRDISERRRAEEALRESEQRLSLAQRVVGMGTFDWDMRSGAVVWTPELEQIFGLPPGGFAGTREEWHRYLHPEDAERVEAEVNRCVAERGDWNLEYRIVRADGEPRWVQGFGRVLADPEGVPIRFIGVNVDVTERKRVEEALWESQERFSSAFEFAAIGKALVAPDGRFLAVNRALCAVLGYREHELLEQTFQEITHPDDLAADLAFVRRTLAGEITTYQMEKRYYRRSGEVMWASLSVSLVRDRDGQPAYFIAQVQDIDARKRAEADLSRLNAELEQRVRERTAELEEANRELEAFSYSVSHDLRAPLRAIDGFSRALAEECAGRLDSEGIRHLERVRAGTSRMGQLIDDLLRLSRLQSSELRPGTVDLSALVGRIAAELRQAAPERSVEFVIAAGVEAQADPELLAVALQNLLGNAWKYTGKHATARIEFGVTERDGRRMYFVRDDGAGFDMAYADKLFGAFQRLHAAGEFEGTGIGLAIVQRIVGRHGGRVWAEAAVEQGATFFFTLANHAAPLPPGSQNGPGTRHAAPGGRCPQSSDCS